MHDAMPALVLDSKALSRTVMNETPTNQANSADKAGAASSTSDEQLVLAFSKGSSHAFEELFSRYKQPIFGFFRTACHRVRSGGGVDAGDFRCPAPRRHPLRTPGALPHVSPRDWFQDSPRISSQSRFSRHFFRPTKLRPRSFPAGCERVRSVGPSRCRKEARN